MGMDRAVELAEGSISALVQVKDVELDGDETQGALFRHRDADGLACIFDDLFAHDVALRTVLLKPPQGGLDDKVNAKKDDTTGLPWASKWIYPSCLLLSDRLDNL